MDELNNIIARDKLYAVIEYFYRYNKDKIEEHINTLVNNNAISSRTYTYTLQTLYIIYDSNNNNNRDDVPPKYSKLFNIEDAIILLYSKGREGILEELYNNISTVINKQYSFMKLVDNIKEYDKYKRICYPYMHLLNEGRKQG